MNLLTPATKFDVYAGDRKVASFATHAEATRAIKEAVKRTGLLASIFSIRQS